MNTIVRAIFFTLIINFCVGIMMAVIVDKDGNQLFGATNISKFQPYNQSQYLEFNSTMSGIISPTAVSTDSTSWVYRLLDLIGIGIIGTLIDMIKQYLFGFINLMDLFIGPMMCVSSGANVCAMRSVIFNILYFLNGLIYIIGAYRLWKGENILE